MQGSDKFFANHYGKKLDKQMEDDMEGVIEAEQKTGRKVTPAYESEPVEEPGWKHKHGGTIGKPGGWDN